MLTCSPGWRPGWLAFQVSGWPVHTSVDGIWYVPSASSVVLSVAHSTHLSSTTLALALPVA